MTFEGRHAVKVVLVTGTDTGVGKTITTTALSRIALDAGLRVAVVKPTQTGASSAEQSDIEVVAALGGCALVTELVRLEDPLAPDTAARRRGLVTPTVSELAERCLSAATGCDLLLVEGAGGVAVRLDTRGGTVLGLGSVLARSGAIVRVVVVTRLALGTLNHTELTVGAVRDAGLDPAGLVLGAVPDALGLAEECNRDELRRVTGLPLLGEIPAGVGCWEPSRFRGACGRWFPHTGWLVQP